MNRNRSGRRYDRELRTRPWRWCAADEQSLRWPGIWASRNGRWGTGAAGRGGRDAEGPLSHRTIGVAEGWYRMGTTAYHIEYRVRRLRELAERDRNT